MTTLKSTLLNIDSSYRNIYPKHIYKSNNTVLPCNPLYFTYNSNIIKINYPNHNLFQGDNIIIQNVMGIYKILSNPIYLINNFKYAMIYFENNLININYKIFVEDLYINIELYGTQNENNLIENIPFNYLLGIKKVLIANDISEENLNLLTTISNDLFNINLLNQNCLFFELPNIFISNEKYYNINQIFKISYLHINGIKLGYINANYPINNYNYQNSYTINKINNENEFEILLNQYSFNTSNEGGDTIQIFKIINSLPGYPYVDNYTIFLKKSFNNITNIELVSSEFPYIDILIKENINDKLYWKNIEDGDILYNVIIENGFYNATTLLDKINLNINKVERINSTPFNKIYNNFDITLDTSSHIISFKPYNLTKLPNSLSIKLITINNDSFYILNVSHPNNIVDINDTITISNSGNITIKDEVNTNQIQSIDSSYINKTHIVYNKNLENQTYDIILGKKSQIKITITNTESSGGEDIIIKSKTKVSFYFNKNDTFGDILGFKNVGDTFSITNYNSVTTNQDNYIYSNNLDPVGNIIQYNNGFINLDGKYNYILMYINDIEYIYTNNNNIQPAFAKILLSGNPGDVLFNTFIQYPHNIYSKNFPISSLSYIDIKFLYPDGNRVNFRNINHSFTLKITENI
jgi:hypothetical protein